MPVNRPHHTRCPAAHHSRKRSALAAIGLLVLAAALLLPHTLWAASAPPVPLTPPDPLQPDQPVAPIHLPIVRSGLPFAPRTVDAIPVAGPPTNRPAPINADLNLALRSYAQTQAHLGLIDIGGPTDDDAPQLATLFRPPRLPAFVAAWQVFDWNWACGENGCQGTPLPAPPVTLISMAAGSMESIYLPARRAQIYGGGFIALVLYAEPTRLTLKYTREDSPVYGYMVHLENVQVDPALLARYRELDAAGRRQLPALRNGDLLGIALGSLSVAVRDTGSFMDPRTRKDWWIGY
jgi:hypothetical protein